MKGSPLTVRHRTDADLVDAARRGDQNAFAVLIHRHAATLVAAGDPHRPVRTLQRTGLRAMRHLDDAPDVDVDAWLLGLADGRGGDARDAPAPATLDDSQFDAAWRQIVRRWPHGRSWRRRPPPAAVWIMTIVAVIVASVALPWLLLRVSTGGDELQQLRAFPIEERRQADEEPEPPEESLPVFEFPTVPEDQPPEPSPPPAATDPTEDVDPTQDPAAPDDDADASDDDGDDGEPADEGEPGEDAEAEDGDANGSGTAATGTDDAGA